MKTKNAQIEDLSTLRGSDRPNQTISHHNQEIALGEIDFTLADVIKTIPPECFHKNPRKAWTAAFISFLLIVLGYCGMAILPWYWLPLLWTWTGIALTGFFMLGHDCGHYTFAKKPWVNDLAGHLFMTPVFYPFYNWRIQHNCHHAHTNKLGGEGLTQLQDISNGKADPYWHPFRVELYKSLSPTTRWIYQRLKGGFWWLITILGWWYQITLDTSKLSTKDRSKVKFSIAISLTFAGIVLPTLLLTTGIWGLIKFWLAPWLMFHFWFGTITLLHHTSPETIWKENTEWNPVQAQLWGTVQCNYPGWFEFFCHDINYHIPHHVSAAIPFYNLRMAHQSLRENWNPYVREVNFSWSLIKRIISECHLYNTTEERYQSVKEVQPQLSVKHLA